MNHHKQNCSLFLPIRHLHQIKLHGNCVLIFELKLLVIIYKNTFLIIYSSGKPTARRIKRIIDATQYQIDAGQKKFGGFLCQQCGLYYSRGEPEDEAEHDKYHAAKNIFKYNVC